MSERFHIVFCTLLTSNLAHTDFSASPTASRGVYDIFVQKDGVSICVGKYDNKGSFGELALMYNTPRAATIIATDEGALWGLVSQQ